MKPRTAKIARVEGGILEEFCPGLSGTFRDDLRNAQVHAIYFENGLQWDAINGWRDGTDRRPNEISWRSPLI